MVAITPAGTHEGRLARTVRAYVALMKPRIIELLLVTTLPAMVLAAGGLPSLHIYEKGAHGLGLGRPDKPAPPWADQLLYWFKERKFTP